MDLGTPLARFIVRHHIGRVFDPGRTVPAQRRHLQRTSRLAPLVSGTRVSRERLAGLDTEWIDARPAGSASRRRILYLHGGGFVAGGLDTHRAMASAISRQADAAVWLPDYSLAPEHPHPAAADECLGAMRELLEQRGVAPEELILGGDSAGGFLTLATLINARDAGLPQPAGAFLLSPLCDAVELDGESYSTQADKDIWFTRQSIDDVLVHYAGPAGQRDPSLNLLARDLSGLAPMRFDVGGAEVLVSDSERAAARARQAGGEAEAHVWPGMWHVFPAFGLLVPEARRAIREIGMFCREKSHGRNG